MRQDNSIRRVEITHTSLTNAVSLRFCNHKIAVAVIVFMLYSHRLL